MIPNLPLYTKTKGESTTLNDRLGTVLAVFQDAQCAEWVKEMTETLEHQKETIETLEARISNMEEQKTIDDEKGEE